LKAGWPELTADPKLIKGICSDPREIVIKAISLEELNKAKVTFQEHLVTFDTVYFGARVGWVIIFQVINVFIINGSEIKDILNAIGQ
jgi:hypothetical protein